jgi:putative tryptophan/tyrosine transport system substrate-binding protein
MRRRDFIGMLGAVATWPVAAHAQQPAMPVVGMLMSGAPGLPFIDGFQRGLIEAGYSDGQNVAIEYRWAEDHRERLPTLAA